MSKPKWVYWVIDSQDPTYEHKANLLSRYNLKVYWIHSVSSLVNQLIEARAFITIVNDEYQSSKTEDIITELEKTPELKSSRLILSVKGKRYFPLFQAAALNFRDLVPFDLPDNDWLFRVMYSSASKPLDYFLPPGQILLGQQLGLYMPGRIVWFKDNTFKIETQIEVPLGSKIPLAGAIAKQLDEDFLTFQVKKIHRHELIYRFSLALEGEITIPPGKEALFMSLLAQLDKFSKKPKTRIFLAVRDVKIRRSLQSFFNSSEYIVRTALQLRSVTQEPLFFSPQAIFVDEKLYLGEDRRRFESMLNEISTQTVIFVLRDPDSTNTQQPDHPQISFLDKFDESQLPALGALIKEKNPDSANNRGYLSSKSPFSLCSVRLDAKLTSIHPEGLTISSGYLVKNFSLCEVSSPLLRKSLPFNIWIKITEVEENTRSSTSSHPYLLTAIFSNLASQDKKDLAQSLASLVESLYTKYLDYVQPEGNILAQQATVDAAASIPAEENLLVRQTSRTVKEQNEYATAMHELLAEPMVRFILYSAVLTLALTFLFTQIIPKIAERYEKSGSVYVEQLKIFSHPKKESEDKTPMKD